ncbi:hypothetical protein B6I21_06045 [candidate division KSB1 bacterium 4572_119]|nr:MAG: hypothetical protein B6I21_06045 [candidate division KSB1 bacterium 4572_119]
MRRGVVKWFDEVKGYGYLESESGEEIFVHFSNIEHDKRFKTLVPGAVVEYEAIIGEMGLKAIYVKELDQSVG